MGEGGPTLGSRIIVIGALQFPSLVINLVENSQSNG
jgi:hypothetical protein